MPRLKIKPYSDKTVYWTAKPQNRKKNLTILINKNNFSNNTRISKDT